MQTSGDWKTTSVGGSTGRNTGTLQENDVQWWFLKLEMDASLNRPGLGHNTGKLCTALTL